MVRCRGVIALDHTQGHTTVGTTPLDEGSARRRDLYPTTYNTHNRQTSVPPAGFEPATPASDRPQTVALDWDRLCWVYKLKLHEVIKILSGLGFCAVGDASVCTG